MSLTPQTKTQDVRTFPHGLVTGEYAPNSHIYDSPWYHAKVKAYGEPSAKDIELAMESQKKARQGQKTTNLKELVATPDPSKPPIASEPPAKPRKNASTSKKSVSKDETIPKTETLIPEQTVAEQLTEAIVTKLMSEHKAAETMDDVLPVQAVIQVKLRPFTHNDVSYWRDSEREKLYRKTKDGKKGEYVGRWDAAQEKICREATDSDSE
jgi:hypothetical protein